MKFGMALGTLILKLGLIFGAALTITLSLCIYLLQKVRALDANSSAKLDSLSIRSFSSLNELQQSHGTFMYIFSVQYPLALLCFTCIYIMKQVFGRRL